jgi:predicted short-subunit dehydrogenase-like oxidoreductase (DUF2520 family)
MKTLNIIGAGRVGRTLGALWQRHGAFVLQDVLTGRPESAHAAVAVMGGGRAVSRLDEMRPADVWMLTPPDDRIAACSEALAGSGRLRPGDVVFHCSGALASNELAAAEARGACAASMHPLKSFADPAATQSFAGTFCTAEGAAAALATLKPAFERIGARISEIDARAKTLYHAASVVVCNDLTALMEAGLRCYERAGIARETARPMMEPLVRETLDNVFRLGTVRALTGPVARGDEAVVERHLRALAECGADELAIYRALGRVAVALAREQGRADADALDHIIRMLDRDA